MYVARDDDDRVSAFDEEPWWNPSRGYWSVSKKADIFQRLELFSGFPKVERGECVEVELVLKKEKDEQPDN